jgi:hypothetical protein
MWHTVKFRYVEVQPDMTGKNMTEQVLVDAVNFTDAETTVTNAKASEYTDFEVVAISRLKANEVFPDICVSGCPNKWFKVKMAFFSLNEKTGKEKKSSYIVYLNADCTYTAEKMVNQKMQGSIQDYTIEQISETKVTDVITQ